MIATHRIWIAVAMVMATSVAGQDPIALEHGQNRVFDVISTDAAPFAANMKFTPTARSVVHVWASSDDVEPILEIRDGAELHVAESGACGPRTAYLELRDVEKGASLSIRLKVMRSGVGQLTVHVRALPIFPRHDAWLKQAGEVLEEAWVASRAGDDDRARTLISDLIDGCLDTDRVGAPRVLSMLARAHGPALMIGEGPRAERAMRTVLASWEGNRPEFEPRAIRMRFNLAAYLQDTGPPDDVVEHARIVARAFEVVRPEDDEIFVTSRSILAMGLCRAGRRDEAIEVLDRAIEPDEGEPAPTPTVRAALLYTLSNWLFEENRLQEALVRGRECVAAYEDLVDEDDFDLLQARLNLADTCFHSGQVATARDMIRDVVEIVEELEDEDVLLLHHARSNLATALRVLGEIDVALELDRAVLAAYERLLEEGHDKIFVARSNLANTLMSAGATQEALSLQQETWSRVRAQPSPDPDHVFSAQKNLSMSLTEVGLYDDAVAMLRDCVALAVATKGENDPDTLAARIDLSHVLGRLGHAEESLAILRTVVVAGRSIPPGNTLAYKDRLIAERNLASALGEFGRDDEAVEILEEVMAGYANVGTLSRRDQRDLLLARSNVASIMESHERYDEALELRRRILEEISSLLDADHHEVHLARSGVGYVLSALGRDDEATAIFRAVAEGYARTVPETDSNRLRAEMNLAESLDDHAVALDMEIRIAEICRRTFPVTASIRLGAEARLMASHLTLGRDDEAATISLAILEAFSGGSRPASDLAAGDLVGMDWSDRWVLDRALSFCGSNRAAREAAFAAVEKISNSASWSLRWKRWAGRSNPEALRLQALLAKLENDLEVRLRGGDPAPLTDLLLERDRVCADLNAAIPPAVRERLAPSASVERVAAALDDNEVAIRFFHYERSVSGGEAPRTWKSLGAHLAAFVIDGSGEVTRVEFGPGERVHEMIDAWVEAVRLDASPAAPQKALRESLVAPLVAAAPDAGRWTVAADGPLHVLPLEALPAIEDGTPLGARVAIRYRMTLKELAASPPPARGDLDFLIVGDVDFDEVVSAEEARELLSDLEFPAVPDGDPEVGLGAVRGGERVFSPLPETRHEVASLLSCHRQAAPKASRVAITEDEAAPGVIEALMPRARHVHLATHGYFRPDRYASVIGESSATDRLEHVVTTYTPRVRAARLTPHSFCGIALSGANRESEAGGARHVLDGSRIAQLDLSGCELVVLSACEGGLGVSRNGAGMASLAEAFLIAGAGAVLASPWEVDDGATRELMSEFYRLLWIEKRSKAEALAGAQTHLRDLRSEDGTPRFDVGDIAGWRLYGDAERVR